MSSIIKGYNCDIFISYRQKDNKGDGWVSEFVESLKTELESTFKEEISVYFDINPHDGLLETHDVDESLRDKLKCLIFIPIISRTYCDPKSFAWEHEFKAFVELTSRDQFGLKIKLPNGNVASRVLPVQIHELKTDDKSLVETVLSGFIRSVEFIYSEPGVNRPLTQSDPEEKNLHKTSYRNQINKVANAVDEIISGLRSEKLSASKDKEATEVPTVADQKTAPHQVRVTIVRKKKVLYTSSSFVIIMALLTFYLFSGGSKLPFEKRDWIIVTDFDNQTRNPLFDKSLYTAFSLSTGQSRYVNVVSRSRMLETLERMKIKERSFIDEDTGREIAAREGISLIIVPGISEVGNKYALTAKIQDTESGDILRSEIMYASTQDEILPAVDRLCKRIRKDLGESRFDISQQYKPLVRVTTSSLDALKLFSQGVDAHISLDFAKACDYYERALNIDTGFTAARASLGSLYVEKFNAEKGKELLTEAVRSVDNLPDREKYSILNVYAVNVEHDYRKGIEYTKRLTDLYPDDPTYHNNLGLNYQNTGQFEEAAREYKAAVTINPNLAVSYGGLIWLYLQKLGRPDSALVWARKMAKDNPLNPWTWCYFGSALVCYDSLALAEESFRKARELSPAFTFNLFRLGLTYSKIADYDEAINILQEIPRANPEESTSAWYDIGINYQLKGDMTEADRYFTKYREYASDVWMKQYGDSPHTYICLGAVAARTGDRNLSVGMLQKAMEMDSSLHYRFAELFCLQGDIPAAIDQMEKAIANGYRDISWIKLNPDLQALQYDIRFRNMLDKYFDLE